jgi:hypothetical protein
MNHSDAVRLEAVDRYLLRQLSGPECEEFELHYFDCKLCAAELADAAVFEENAKAVLRADVAKVGSGAASGWRSWWSLLWPHQLQIAPALAACALLILVAYQGLIVIPRLRAPQAMTSFALAPVARGDDRQERHVSSQTMHYAIYMDPTWDASYAAYTCAVVDASGATRFSVRVPAPPPGKPIEVLLAGSALNTGRYVVIIRNAAEPGKPEADLATYGLQLRVD